MLQTADIMEDVFANSVPLICEALDEIDDEDKFAFVGSTIQTYLSSLIDYCLYKDYLILKDSALSLEWQRKLAERLVEILKEMETENA